MGGKRPLDEKRNLIRGNNKIVENGWLDLGYLVGGLEILMPGKYLE